MALGVVAIATWGYKHSRNLKFLIGYCLMFFLSPFALYPILIAGVYWALFTIGSPVR